MARVASRRTVEMTPSGSRALQLGGGGGGELLRVNICSLVTHGYSLGRVGKKDCFVNLKNL